MSFWWCEKLLEQSKHRYKSTDTILLEYIVYRVHQVLLMTSVVTRSFERKETKQTTKNKEKKSAAGN